LENFPLINWKLYSLGGNFPKKAKKMLGLNYFGWLKTLKILKDFTLDWDFN